MRTWTAIDRSAADAWRLPHSIPYAPGRVSAVLPESSAQPPGNAGPRRPPFSIVSYNILAHEFAEPHLYRHCPRWALDRHYRAGKIYSELSEAKADIVRCTASTRVSCRHVCMMTTSHQRIPLFSFINSQICLQEVDHIFHSFWLPRFRKLGYDGRFKQRTGGQSDGVATLFRVDRFELVSSEEVEYCAYPHVEARDNVALLFMLRDKSAGSPPVAAPPKWPAVSSSSVSSSSSSSSLPIASSSAPPPLPPLLCVGNTHILYNRKRGDLKLGQMQLFCERASLFCRRFSGDSAAVTLASATASSMSPTFICCGDLNATPDSPLMEFMLCQRLDCSRLDRRLMDGLDDSLAAPNAHAYESSPCMATSSTSDAVLDLAGGSSDRAMHEGIQMVELGCDDGDALAAVSGMSVVGADSDVGAQSDCDSDPNERQIHQSAAAFHGVDGCSDDDGAPPAVVASMLDERLAHAPTPSDMVSPALHHSTTPTGRRGKQDPQSFHCEALAINRKDHHSSSSASLATCAASPAPATVVHHDFSLASVYAPLYPPVSAIASDAYASASSSLSSPASLPPLVPTPERRVTQYHATHRLMVDYTLFTPHALCATAYLELPPPSQIGRRLMPSAYAPSDHFMLHSQFEWTL